MVGLMILDRREAKSNIKVLLSKQGMAILTTLRGSMVDETDHHIRHVVAEGEPICRSTSSGEREPLMPTDKIVTLTLQP
jgi:hypothetical protein